MAKKVLPERIAGFIESMECLPVSDQSHQTSESCREPLTVGSKLGRHCSGRLLTQQSPSHVRVYKLLQSRWD